MKYRLTVGNGAYIDVPEDTYKKLKECEMRCEDYSVLGKQITVDCDSKYPIVIIAPIVNFEVLDDGV